MSDLYSTNLEELLPSSNSEFDWNKRVQITNEVPPVDLIDGANHLIKKDPLWRYFFGNSFIDFEVPYNINTNGEEIFDKDGNLTEASISKYVNGIRIKDFGDQPKIINQELKIPIGMHMEEYGVLLPEFDLLLHEVYKYLDRLYPDHPDFVRILTDNEINDNLNQAGALIDYQLNTVLIDWLANEMEYGELKGADLQRGKDYEALKMKIRNLWNHAFRRKLFGALQGYKWFGSDLWQHISVFQVGQYLPLIPYKNDDTTVLYNNTIKDFQWYRGWEKEPPIDDRSINKWHALTEKKFRMIDWTNESYDYHVEPVAEVYGTAHSTPNSMFDLYEFKMDNNTLIPDTSINTDFKAGSKVTVDGKDAYLSIIYTESSWDFSMTLNYDINDDLVSYLPDITEKPNSIAHVLETTESYPQFTKWLRYGFTKNKGTSTEERIYTIKDFLASADKNYSTQMTDYNTCFAPGIRHSFLDATAELLALFSNERDLYSELNLTLSPFQKGEFYASIGETFTFYPSAVNAEILRDPGTYLDPYIVYYKDVLDPESVLHYNQIIANREIKKDQEHLYIAEFAGFKKGWMEFTNIKMEPLYDDEVEELINKVNNDTLTKQGIIYKKYKNMAPVIFFGKPYFELGDYNADGARPITRIRFNITGFPKIKDFYMMRMCYGSGYMNLLEEKFTQLKIVFNDRSIQTGNSFERNNYFVKFMQTRYQTFDPNGNSVSGFKHDFDLLKIHVASGTAYQGDSYWMRLLDGSGNNGSAPDYWNGYVISGWSITGVYKSVRLRDAYIKFVANCGSLPVYDGTNYDIDAFNAEWQKLDKFFKDALIEETNLMKVDCVNNLDRSFYKNLNPSSLNDNQKKALKRVEELDQSLDSMMVNQALMLDKQPSDIYMKNIPDPDIFLDISEQMDFYSFFDCVLDPVFECYIDYKPNTAYGTGVILDWDFGSIQLCQLVEDSVDMEVVDPSTGVRQDLYEHFASTSSNKGWVNEYDFVSTIPPYLSYKYLDLNEDISVVADQRNHWDRKFAFTSWNFIEQINMTRRNIIGTPVAKYIMDIRSIINVDEDPYKITFEDEESYRRIELLSTGDYISGISIENDTYIISIDAENRRLFVNRPLSVTGDFVLKYHIGIDVFPIELDDHNFYDYRENLDRKNILDKGNPFWHGFYGSDEWPHPSNAFINGPIDIRNYKETLLNKLRDFPAFQTAWNDQVLKLYIGEADKNDSYVLPAFVNNKGDLFYELNAYKTYEDDKYLCKKEILDYFTGCVAMLSRASDAVNVGFNITAETDNSGNYIFVTDDKYTDTNIHNKFKTLGWNSETLPLYYEIGTGQLDLFDDDDDDSKQPEDYIDKSYYNYDVYAGADPSDKDTRLYNIQNADFQKIDDSFPTVSGSNYQSSYTKITLPSDFIIPPDIKHFYILWNNNKYTVSGSGIDYITTNLITTPSGSGGNIVFNPVVGSQNIMIAIQDKQIIEPKEYEIKEGPAVWSRTIIDIKEPVRTYIDHIAKPVFSGTLGEHEVHRKELFLDSGDPNTFYTTIQFSTIKQEKEVSRQIDLKTIFEQYTIEESFKNVFLETVPVSYKIVDTAKVYQLEPPEKTQNLNYYILDKAYQDIEPSLIVYEKGHWNFNQLVFGGLIGSGSQLQLTMLDVPEDVYISIRNVLTYQSVESNNTSFSEHQVLKFVVLAKLLSGLKILKGNLINLVLYTYEEMEKIFSWVYNRVNNSNVQSITGYSSVSALIAGEIGNQTAIKMSILPTSSFDYYELNNVTPTDPDEFVAGVSRHSIYHFMMAAADSKYKLDNGTVIAMVYYDNHFLMYQLLQNKYYFQMLNQLRLPSLSDSEFDTYWGKNGTTKDHIFPIEANNAIKNTIKLPDQIVTDSLSAEIKLNFVFETEGWKWDDYFSDNPQKSSYNIMEQPIYYDKDNLLLYTYNKKGLDNQKYVIELQQHRYFKNCLYLIGVYQTKEKNINGNLEQFAYVNALDGVLFECSWLSPSDRLLELEEIRIRSKYSEELESQFFSSYTTLEGQLKGIYEDPNDNTRYMLFGYRDEPGLGSISNKLSVISEISKIMPLKNNQEYTTSWCDFDTAAWADGARIEWPEVTDITIKNALSSNTNFDFKFYKNTIILEGIIDTSSMNGIDFSINPRIGDALTYILPGDEIVGLVGLSSSKSQKVYEQTVTETQLLTGQTEQWPITLPTNPGTSPIEDVDFKNGYFVTASDDGKVTVHKTSSLVSTGAEISSYVFVITEVNSRAGGSVPYNTKLTGLAWDDQTQHWVLSYTSSIQESWFIEFTAEDGTYKIIDTDPGVDINTYQVIRIVDVDSRQNESTNFHYEQNHNQYVYVSARDVAMKQADLLPETVQTYTGVNDWTKTGSGSISATTNSQGKNGIQIDGTADILTKSLINVDPEMYTEVNFELQQLSGDGSADFYVDRAFVADAFVYNRDTMSWFSIMENLTGDKVPLVSNFRIKDMVRAQAFFIKNDFFSDTEVITASLPVPPKSPMWPIPKYNGVDLFTKDSYVYGINGNPLVWDYAMTEKVPGKPQFGYTYILDASGRKTFVNPPVGSPPNVTGSYYKELNTSDPQLYTTRPWLRSKENRNYVLFGDPGQELDNSYPPPRAPYSGGSLPYVKTKNHQEGWAGSPYQDKDTPDETNPDTSISWWTWAKWANPGTTFNFELLPDGVRNPISDTGTSMDVYLTPYDPNSPRLNPSILSTKDPMDYPYVTIEDISNYFIDHPELVGDAKYVPNISDISSIQTIAVKEVQYGSNTVKVDSNFYDQYGWHIEILRNESGNIKTRPVVIIEQVGLGKEGLHTKENYYTYIGETADKATSLTISKTTVRVPELCLKPNSILAGNDNDLESCRKWLNNMYTDRQINVNLDKWKIVNKKNLPGSEIAMGLINFLDTDSSNSIVLKIPDYIVDLDYQENDSPTKRIEMESELIDHPEDGIYTIEGTDLNFQTGFKYEGTVNYQTFIPYTQFCVLPDHILFNKYNLFLEYLKYSDEKIYFDMDIIHPQFKSYPTPRYWPRFEVPLDYQNEYLYSDDWVREVYIYTEEYQEYAYKYIAFINSNEFKTYINNLRKHWGYGGMYNYEIDTSSYTQTGWFNNGWDGTNTSSQPRNLIDPYTQVDPYLKSFNVPQRVMTPEVLKKLPLPYSSNNIETVVVKMNLGQNVIGIKGSFKNGSYKVVDFKSKFISKINTRVGSFAPVILGTYNPFSSDYYIESITSKLKSAKFVKTNSKNMEIRIYGDKIFVYGPTKTWTPKKVQNQIQQIEGEFILQEDEDWAFGQLTQNYHWKMAQLPNRRRSEVKAFQTMSITEAYNYVNELYLTTKISVSKMIDNLSSGSSSTVGSEINDPSDLRNMLQKYLDWLDKYTANGDDGYFDNAPIKFDTEDIIPPYLKLNNCVFIQTEKGKVPVFSFDVSPNPPKTEYFAREYDIQTTGDIEHRQLKKDNYIQYLCDYATVILGDSRFESFFDFDYVYTPQNKIMFGTEWAGCIKDVWLTDNVLGIITKYDDVLTIRTEKLYCREDIEDFNNWTVNQVDPRYLLETQSEDNYAIKTIAFVDNNNITSTTFNMFPIEHPTKGFTLNVKSIIGNNVILAGYVQANDMVKNMTERQTTYSLYNQLYPNDGWKYFDTYTNKQNKEEYKKFPVIFYSEDGGQSFQRADIPSKGPVPLITAYTDEMTTSDGSTIEKNALSNIEAYSIHRVGEEYRVWLKNPDIKLLESNNNDLIDKLDPQKVLNYDYTPLAYTYFTYGETGLVYNSDIIDAMDETEVKLSVAKSNKVIDNVTINLVQNGVTKFVSQKPFTLKSIDNIKITNVLSSNIEIEPQQTLDEQEQLRVLVAINPSKNITNQSRFIELKSEYINAEGKFIVPEVVEVTSEINADRMFSYREQLSLTARKTDKTGILSIKEDLEEYDRHFYQYEEPYIDHGKEMYQYKILRNSFGGPVVLCNDQQNYLSELDTENPHNYFLLWNLIDTGTDVNSLPVAPMIVPNIDTSTVNVAFTNEVMNDTINHSYISNGAKILDPKDVMVKSFDIDKKDPKVLITSSGFSAVYNWMSVNGEEQKQDTTTIDSYFYLWPVVNNTPIGKNDLLKTKIYNWEGDIVGSTEKLDDPTSFGKAILEICSYNETYATYLGETFRERDIKLFDCVDYVQINGIYYVKNMLNNCIMMNSNIKIQFTAFIPYIFKAGYKQFINEKFVHAFNDNFKNKDLLESPLPEYPISGVYLNPAGYGGDKDNTSWEVEQPYEIDYIAFKDEIQYGSTGRPIYLTNPYSEVLFSKHGFFLQKTTDKPVVISYDNLANDDNIVTFYKDYPGSYNTYNIYRRQPSEYYSWYPDQTIYYNADYHIRGIENPTLPKIDMSGGQTVPGAFWNPYNPFAGQTTPEGYENFTYATMLSRFVLLRNGVEQHPDCSVTFRDGDRVLSNYAWKDNSIWYFYNNPATEKMPVIEELTITITDSHGFKYQHTFDVAPDTDQCQFKIVSINPIKYINQNLYGTQKINIVFDGSTIPGTTVQIRSNSINCVINNPYMEVTKTDTDTQTKTNPVEFSCELSSFSQEARIKTDTTELNLYIQDIQNARLLTQRNWGVNNLDKSSILTEIYANDQDIKSLFNVSFDLSTSQLKATSPNTELVLLSDVIETSTLVVNMISQLHKFVFLYGEYPKDRAYKIEYNQSDIYIDGLYGRILLRVPRYENMKQLIDINQQIIRYKTPKVLFTYTKKSGEFNHIEGIDKNFGFIQLKDTFQKQDIWGNNLYAAYNDNQPHYIMIRIMPLNSIINPVTLMNNKNYINEVSFQETQLYSFDRIWWNENSYPVYPLTIKGTQFNKDSYKYFNDVQYKNKDGLTIYACNEDGMYIKYGKNNKGLTSTVLGDEFGSLSEDIFANVDPRFNMLEPVYTSNLDWFLKEFYVEGQESNLFWQYIMIKNNYNSYTQNFDIVLSIYSPVKKNGILVKEPEKLPYTTIYQSLSDNFLPESIKPTEISFVLGIPDKYYSSVTSINKYGIQIKNYLFPSELYRDIYIGKSAISNCDINASYIINSSESLTDKSNKDEAVNQITEMGLFDKNHHLIAYMTHPIVEYRSDVQHISYTLAVSSNKIHVI